MFDPVSKILRIKSDSKSKNKKNSYAHRIVESYPGTINRKKTEKISFGSVPFDYDQNTPAIGPMKNTYKKGTKVYLQEEGWIGVGPSKKQARKAAEKAVKTNWKNEGSEYYENGNEF